MKKCYQKPMLFFESFRLSDTIAGCGGNISNLGDHNTCSTYIADLGFSIFNTEGICDYPSPGGDDDICEHVPFPNMGGFGS